MLQNINNKITKVSKILFNNNYYPGLQYSFFVYNIDIILNNRTKISHFLRMH